ncbi:MAG: thioredoxin-dependent thiol peroxidase [Patescibacteria group bacterium]
MNAPNFSLPDQNGDTHKLADYAGKWLVIYFYPKDSTPGCTKQACDIRDGREILEDLGVSVIGISKDSVESHKKFAEKQNLNFTILSDESTETIQEFGAWGEKSMFGKKYMGIMRNTYLVNPSGEIVKTYEKVSPAKHLPQILKGLKELQAF